LAPTPLATALADSLRALGLGAGAVRSPVHAEG